MAQRRRKATRADWLRRWGARPARMAAVALGVVAACTAGISAWGATADKRLCIERAEEIEQTTSVEDAGGVEQQEDVETADPPSYVVHVDGAVGAPGVVHVSGEDVRVYDAVEAAGGLLEDSDTTGVNLAESLVDGAKIHIPHADELTQGQAATPSGQVSTQGATGDGGGIVLVNINQAGIEELQTLSGVGEVTARAIVDERERNGPYASCEDLMRVTGIGEKKYEKVKDYICV